MVNEQILKAVEEALKKSKKRNFVQSVDLAINLKDVDLKNPANRIDLIIELPHGRGSKRAKVAVIAGGELAARAKGHADLIIDPSELPKLKEDRRRAKKIAKNYHFFIADATLMPTIGRILGPILGPRGKMPRPLPPTADPVPVIEKLKRSVRLRSRDRPTMHCMVGTEDMPPEQIAENIEAVLRELVNRLERGKGNIASVYVKTTMGPSVKLEGWRNGSSLENRGSQEAERVDL